MKLLRFAGYQVVLTVALANGITLRGETWADQFRKAYPYHIQTVALSAEDAARHRTLIISEPPPTITLDQIRSFDPAFAGALVHVQMIGVDGWVKDVVIDLPPMEQRDLSELLDRLQQRLFGTSYKAYVTPLPSTPVRLSPAKLNLQVTSGDLRTWLFGNAVREKWGSLNATFVVAAALMIFGIIALSKKRIFLGLILSVVAAALMISASALLTWMLLALTLGLLSFQRSRKMHRGQALVCAVIALAILVPSLVVWVQQHKGSSIVFSPLFGGGASSCATILDEHKSGVFLSGEPGLVLWSFNKKVPIESLGPEIREFALDSDLIVGAVSSSDQIGILARERTTPVASLPPLRLETVLLLASARENELSQSYERKNPFAGRYDDHNRRDWAPIYLSPRLIDTEYGSLLNITDQLLKGWTMHGQVRYARFEYPAPATYPFDQDLMTKLGTKQLTFNWNTKGAGYVIKSDPYEIFALNRTGSLPIDYLAQGKPGVQAAEDTAYNYYSGLNDPNLARVVQYAAMYQIFHHFGVIASANPTEAPAAVESPLLKPLTQLVSDIAALKDDDLSGLKDDSGGELVQGVREIRDNLRTLQRSDSDGSLQQRLIAALASRDNFRKIEEISDDETRQNLMKLLEEVQEFGPAFVSEDGRNSLRSFYEMTTGRRRSGWIHTPSIVESEGSGKVVGGHNLSSAVTVFEADQELTAGKVLVSENNGTRTVRYNPSDDAKIGETVRAAARDETQSIDAVQADIERALGTNERAPVDINTGLGFNAAVHPDPLRGFQPSQAPGRIADVGWRRTAVPVPESDSALLRQLGGRSRRPVLVARDSSGSFVISAPPAAVIQAGDLASGTDAFLGVTRGASRDQIAIHFRGFDDRQAEGFLRNLEAHTEDEPIIASTEETIRPDELAAVLNGKYDIANARVLDDAQVIVTDGGRTKEFTNTIAIPAREAGLPGILVKIRITLANLADISHDVAMGISQKIQLILRSMGPQDDIRTITEQLTRELRKDNSFRAVRAQVQREDKTFLYGHNEKLFTQLERASNPS